MSDPGEAPPTRQFLDPISIEELRARVAARRVARTQRAPPKQVAGKKRAATIPCDLPSSPAVQDEAAAAWEAEMEAQRQRLAAHDAKMAVHLPIESPGFHSAAAAAANPPEELLPPQGLSGEEARLIRLAIDEADAVANLLRTTALASDATSTVVNSKMQLIRAIVDWMLEDPDMDDILRLDIQARFFAEYGPDSHHAPGTLQAVLKSEFDLSQTTVHKASPVEIVDYFDSVVHNCPVNLRNVWLVDYMLQDDSLGAFQFRELCRLGPALAKSAGK